MLIKVFTVFVGILFWCHVHAQSHFSSMNDNGLLFRINNDGTLFNAEKKPFFSYDTSLNNHFFNSVGIWIAAKDQKDSIYGAVSMYNEGKQEFWPGPIDTISGIADDTSYWNKVWYLNQEAIDKHKFNFKNPDYETPKAIETWPGSNQRPGNYNTVLAPFVDLNANRKYEPELGEFPFITGENMSYLILNDMYSGHQVSGANSLGIELYAQFFTLKGMANTVFAQYRLVNRSTTTYDSLFFGIFSDFELGNRNDNYTATDQNLNMIYGYDGYDTDQGSGGFGDNLPTAAVVFLNHNLYASMTFNNSNAPYGRPEKPSDFYNYLKAYWKDNTPLLDQLNGYGSGNKTRYIFSGDPCSGQGWTEPGELMLPGERTMTGSVGPFTLAKGGSVRVDLAFLVGTAPKSAANSVCSLKNKAVEVKQFWQNNLSSLQSKESAIQKLLLYPNPLRDELIQFNLPITENDTLFIQHGSGVKNRISVSEITHVPAGFYVLELHKDGKLYRGKLIKQ